MQVERDEAITSKIEPKNPGIHINRRQAVIAGRPMVEPLEARIAPANIITVTALNETALAAAFQTAKTSGLASTIDFATGLKGTIHLTSTLAIPGDVTINGTGIVLKGNGTIQDLSITGGVIGGAGITLNGLKITNGKALSGATGGGVYIDYIGGTITLNQCVIAGNHAIGQKGTAASSDTSGSNGGDGDGGGIAIVAGTVTIQNSTISGNSAVGGAGGAGGYNGGQGEGGGIFNEGILTLVNSHITGNTAVGGAGTAGANGAPYTVAAGMATAATPAGSGGNAYGGGIANAEGTVLIQTTGKNTSVISGNTAKGGAGGNGGKSYNGSNGTNFHIVRGAYGGPVQATGGSDGGAGASGGNGGNASGGGISSTDGSVTIMSSTISGNTVAAGSGGKGTSGGNGGNGGNGGKTATTHSNGMTYYGATYYGYAGGSGGDGGDGGNAGIAQGGGVFSQDALTIQISTVSGNTAKAAAAGAAGHGGAAGKNGALYPSGGNSPTKGAGGTAGSTTPSGGGGIYFGGGELLISLDTIAKNGAQDGGGVNVTADTSASIHNSTIALNSASISGGGLFVAQDTVEATVISSIIAQNKTTHKTGTLANFYGTLSTDSIENVTIGTAVKTTLALHDGGTMETLLPVSGLTTFANSASTNPEGWLTDQDGQAFPTVASGTATMEPGSVQTLT